MKQSLAMTIDSDEMEIIVGNKIDPRELRTVKITHSQRKSPKLLWKGTKKQEKEKQSPKGG